MKSKLLIAALAVLASAGCNEGTTTTTPTGSTPAATSSTTVERDNTGINVRDRSDIAQTATDQNQNQSDIDITADIRKRVIDTDMSVNAQNVKIITQDGKVTLRGPVNTADEKSQIERLAHEVAGPENVENQLEVQP